MQKRLLNMLVIGGVAMLCFAPRFLEAEDETPLGRTVRPAGLLSNVNDAEPPPCCRRTRSPVSPTIPDV
jgi:hypothetical protein